MHITDIMEHRGRGVGVSFPPALTLSAGAQPAITHGLARAWREGGLAVLVLSVPALLVLSGFGGSSQAPGSRLLVASIVGQLPLVVCAVMLHVRKRASDRTNLGHVVELGARVAVAEAALRRDEERLHELRATVVGIALASRLLRDEDASLPPAAKGRLEMMYDAEIARLERLLSDQPQEAARALELDELILPLVVSLRSRGQRVHWEGAGCRVVARADDVTEIVHVLLENSARHAPGCEVTVETVTAADWVSVRVSDDGDGVPGSLVPSLFDWGSRSPRSPGRGIGLHIARRLALEMGGTLSLDQTPQTPGAAFTLTLPTAGAAAAATGSLSWHARSA